MANLSFQNGILTDPGRGRDLRVRESSKSPPLEKIRLKASTSPSEPLAPRKVEKHGLAPITTLGDMVRQARRNNARDRLPCLLSTQLLDPVPLVREQLQDAAIADQVPAADDDEPGLLRLQEVRDLPSHRGVSLVDECFGQRLQFGVLALGAGGGRLHPDRIAGAPGLHERRVVAGEIVGDDQLENTALSCRSAGNPDSRSAWKPIVSRPATGLFAAAASSRKCRSIPYCGTKPSACN
jgi:hypothetical protein